MIAGRIIHRTLRQWQLREIGHDLTDRRVVNLRTVLAINHGSHVPKRISPTNAPGDSPANNKHPQGGVQLPSIAQNVPFQVFRHDPWIPGQLAAELLLDRLELLDELRELEELDDEEDRLELLLDDDELLELLDDELLELLLDEDGDGRELGKLGNVGIIGPRIGIPT